jgi:hypothetical protein
MGSKTAAKLYLEGISGVIIKDHRIVLDSGGMVTSEEFLIVAPPKALELIRGEGFFAPVSSRSGLSPDTYELKRTADAKKF